MNKKYVEKILNSQIFMNYLIIFKVSTFVFNGSHKINLNEKKAHIIKP